MLEIIHNDTRVDLAAAPCPEPGSQPGGTAALILRTLLMTSPTDCSVTHLTPTAVKKTPYNGSRCTLCHFDLGIARSLRSLPTQAIPITSNLALGMLCDVKPANLYCKTVWNSNKSGFSTRDKNLNPGSSADALVQNNSYPCFAPHWKMTAAKMAELEASKGRAGQPEEVTDVETLQRCKHFPVFFQKALLSLKCWLHHWIRKQAPCFYQPGSSSGYYKTWLPTEILPRGELRWQALIS